MCCTFEYSVINLIWNKHYVFFIVSTTRKNAKYKNVFAIEQPSLLHQKYNYGNKSFRAVAKKLKSFLQFGDKVLGHFYKTF